MDVSNIKFDFEEPENVDLIVRKCCSNRHTHRMPMDISYKAVNGHDAFQLNDACSIEVVGATNEMVRDRPLSLSV